MRLLAAAASGLLLMSGVALGAESATIYGMLADEPQFDATHKDFSAKGNVALLTSEGFLTGESLRSSEGGQLLTLQGNVVVLRGSERVKASRLVLDRRSGEFAIFDAEVEVDPNLKPKEAMEGDFLGISPEEMAFEAKRRTMLENIRRDLERLREDYVRSRNRERLKRQPPGESERVKDLYSTLLERLVRTQHQQNLVFESLPAEAQQRYEARRKATSELLDAHPEIAARYRDVTAVGGYTSFRAAALYRDAEGIFRIEGATITPCRCGEEGMPPLYSLSARSGRVKIEGYATLRGATIEVGSVPIAYTPFLLFPVKRRRQSGFLRPYFYVSRSSRVLGVPFFLTLGEHADATLTVSDFSGRGIRYDLEGRLQLSPESRLEAYGELIKDRKYLSSSRAYQERLADEYEAARAAGKPASELESLQERRHEPQDRRWFVQGSWNVPMTAWASAKAKGEMVSDTSYLSDFGKDADTTPGLSLLRPPQTAKRFLMQELSTEYYGDAATVSARVQGARDLLSLRTGETPVRLPKLEFHLLPKRYFDLPLAYDHYLSFERVRRINRSQFVDLASEERTSIPSAENPDIPAGSVAANRRKDVDEPYIAGDRWHSRASLVAPLPANDYVNASVSLGATETIYRFKPVNPMGELWPSQSYFTYSAAADVPVFSEFEFFSREERALEARLRHDFVPYMGFTVIPEVHRSSDFPTENQTFYASDNVVSKQELAFGLRSTWTLFREGFVESGAGPARVPAGDPGVGAQRNFEAALAKSDVKPGESPSALLEFSGRPEARKVFRLWSETELDGYAMGVQAQEHDSDYVWTGTRVFRKSQRWVMQPLSLGLSSSYNFRARQSEREINEREKWRPGQPWTKVEPWGDVVLATAWSVAPLLPLSAQWNNTWSVQWSRWVKSVVALSTELPFGLGIAFSKSDSYAPTETSLKQDQELGYSASYKPWNWLVLSHGWTKKRTWVDGIQVREAAVADRPKASEFDHTDTQAISFVNLQDCLDITLKRTKEYKQREYEATWSLGINMSFFGQRTGAIEIGDPLNREIQSRTRR